MAGGRFRAALLRLAEKHLGIKRGKSRGFGGSVPKRPLCLQVLDERRGCHDWGAFCWTGAGRIKSFSSSKIPNS